MKSQALTPEESLLLISKTIEATKERFRESGHIFIFWGTLTLIVFGSQHILGLLGFYKFMMVPVYLFPLGAVGMAFYIRREYKTRNSPRTLIGNILGSMGWVIGMNLMLMGFLCSDKLGDALGPVFLVLLAIMIIVSGASIKSKPLIIGGILLNLIALGSFFISRDYHGFSMMVGSVIGLIIPGLLLNRASRKQNV